MLIVIVGTIGSGKGTFCKYLAEQGFRNYGVGKEVAEFIKEDLAERGPVSREKLQYWGNEARKSIVYNFWDGRIIQRIVKDNSIDSCYDSAKYPDEIERLVEFAKGFGDGRSCVVAIDAFPPVRFQRLKNRNREGDPKTWEEFCEMNRRDLEGYKDGTGQNTSACLKMADKKIFNHGFLDDLKKETAGLVGELRGENCYVR